MSTKTFGGRLYEIRKTYRNDKGKVMSIRQFADFLGVNFATYNKWENDDASATSSNLIDICNKCNVSADYLLGLSKESTRDLDLKAVCEYTGLSEKAVKVLNDRQKSIKDFQRIKEEEKEKIIDEEHGKEKAEFFQNFIDSVIKNQYQLPSVLSLIIEESATEQIEAKIIEGEKWTGKDEYYTLNPFSKDDAVNHASELIENIYNYISLSIPTNSFYRISKHNNFTVQEIKCRFDKSNKPFVYIDPSTNEITDEETGFERPIDTSEYIPASDFANTRILDSIKEQLLKLRKSYQSRPEEDDN